MPLKEANGSHVMPYGHAEVAYLLIRTLSLCAGTSGVILQGTVPEPRCPEILNPFTVTIGHFTTDSPLSNGMQI